MYLTVGFHSVLTAAGIPTRGSPPKRFFGSILWFLVAFSTLYQFTPNYHQWLIGNILLMKVSSSLIIRGEVYGGLSGRGWKFDTLQSYYHVLMINFNYLQSYYHSLILAWQPVTATTRPAGVAGGGTGEGPPAPLDLSNAGIVVPPPPEKILGP
jgi:hypothetical protein